MRKQGLTPIFRSLKYALNGREMKAIVMQRLIKVDGKVRTDPTYPAGFMDVITIEKTGEHFRLVYDTRAVSPSTASLARRLSTSSARSRGCSWARAASHSWLRMTHARK